MDTWEWLFHEIRQALEPITKNGQIVSTRQARQTVTTALALLQTLENPTIQAFTSQLSEKLDDLLAPLDWLEQALAPWREGYDPHLEAWITWAWQHQKELNLTIEQILPASYLDLVTAFWNALSLFHRSSSLAESLHSWLRPYLQIHRGMPEWLLPLLQLAWNHHIFQRGKRQGSSPMALAGLHSAPSLSELFDQLACSKNPVPVSADFLRCRKSVTLFLLLYEPSLGFLYFIRQNLYLSVSFVIGATLLAIIYVCLRVILNKREGIIVIGNSEPQKKFQFSKRQRVVAGGVIALDLAVWVVIFVCKPTSCFVRAAFYPPPDVDKLQIVSLRTTHGNRYWTATNGNEEYNWRIQADTQTLVLCQSCFDK